MTDFIKSSWPWVVTLAAVALAAVTSAHVILYKRDVRAAIGWTGLIWLSPFLGAVLYTVLGVNRLQRKAGKLHRSPLFLPPDSSAVDLPRPEETGVMIPQGDPFATLARMVDGITRQPLTDGNRIEPLVNGEEAYPAMLEEIDSASGSIARASIP